MFMLKIMVLCLKPEFTWNFVNSFTSLQCNNQGPCADAADALASQVTDEDREVGLVYPPLNRIRQTSLHVGKAVANMAYKLGMFFWGGKAIAHYLSYGLFTLMFVLNHCNILTI